MSSLFHKQKPWISTSLESTLNTREGESNHHLVGDNNGKLVQILWADDDLRLFRVTDGYHQVRVCVNVCERV